MLKSYGYLLSLYIFTFLFAVSYILPCCKDVIFMVYFNKNNDKAINEVKAYRIFFINLSIAFFILSVIFTFFTDNILYLSSLITIFVAVMLFKFYKSNKEILKLKLISCEVSSKASFFIKLKKHHYLLHIFTVLYMFLRVKCFKNDNPFLFNSYYYINPVSALFIAGFFAGIYLFIKKAPHFAEKKLKDILINYIYLISFTAVYILFISSEIFITANYTYIIYLFIYLVFLIFLNIIYIRYVNKINKPFEFKVENAHLYSKRLIELSYDGTRIFLNFKNKKACLILAGLILYLIIYISVLLMLTI